MAVVGTKPSFPVGPVIAVRAETRRSWSNFSHLARSWPLDDPEGRLQKLDCWIAGRFSNTRPDGLRPVRPTGYSAALQKRGFFAKRL